MMEFSILISMIIKSYLVVQVKYAPATTHKGAHFKVSSQYSNQKYPFDYSADNPIDAAFNEYLNEVLPERKSKDFVKSTLTDTQYIFSQI